MKYPGSSGKKLSEDKEDKNIKDMVKPGSKLKRAGMKSAKNC